MDKVREYLQTRSSYWTDPKTGEVNCTALAEDAALEFDLDDGPPEYNVPEWLFDLAVEIAGYGKS